MKGPSDEGPFFMSPCLKDFRVIPDSKITHPKDAPITHPIDEALLYRDKMGRVDSETRAILRSRKKPFRVVSNMPTIPIAILFRYMRGLYDIL